MKALIVENAYAQNPSQLSQARRIAEELQALGVSVHLNKNFNLARITDGKVFCQNYDFCVFLDKDRVAARLLEKGGIKLFNCASAIEVCDDKMLTNIALSNANINVPDCLYAPLCYTAGSGINGAFLCGVEDALGYPMVAKTNYGSLGAGVTLLNNRQELFQYEERHLTLPHFYQRFIDCGAGEDVRVIVVGGKVICAMKRRNETDFRSNIELGGKGEKFEVTPEMERLCLKVAEILNLDYCGVDVLRGKDGKLHICEVNSNAFFAAAEKVCGVNVAGAYAGHMVKNK